MKNQLLILSLIIFPFQIVFGQKAHGPEITFEETTHSFGNISKDDTSIKYGLLMHEFRFKNTGDEPLYIYSAESSCGCHCGHGPKDPVQPGKIGVIHYSYSAKHIGGIREHNLQVVSNAKTPIVRLKGCGYIYDQCDTLLPTNPHCK